MTHKLPEDKCSDYQLMEIMRKHEQGRRVEDVLAEKYIERARAIYNEYGAGRRNDSIVWAERAPKKVK